MKKISFMTCEYIGESGEAIREDGDIVYVNYLRTLAKEGIITNLMIDNCPVDSNGRYVKDMPEPHKMWRKLLLEI